MKNRAIAVTNGIQIGVETFYQDEISYPLRGEHVFAYRITIENKSTYRVQLLRRHWHIFDSQGEWREVAGEGVVGQQPMLSPGEKYQYVSGCHLSSDIGAMHGTFSMVREADGAALEIQIPRFELIARSRLN